jgi:hypothetical protein
VTKPTPFDCIDALPRDQLPAALARIAARLLEVPPPTTGRMLTPDDVAARFRVNRRWVYRHADQLGAERLSDRVMRFPEDGLAARVARLRR